MSSKEPDPVRLYGSTIILKYVAAMQALIQPVRVGKDLEAVHDMRVASRRARTALEIFAPVLPARRVKDWQKGIEQVTGALGAARDSDVQIQLLQSVLASLPTGIERPGLRRILLRVSQKRQQLQQNVLAALADLDETKLLESLTIKLNSYPKPERQSDSVAASVHRLAHKTIQQRLSTLLMYEPFIHRPECAKELHAMRIDAKRLRYNLEIFADLAPEQSSPFLLKLKTTQDLLGQLHDCDIWVEELPAFIEREKERTLKYFGYSRPIKRLLPGFEFFIQNRTDQRNLVYNEFVTFWDQCQADGVWQNLSALFAEPAATPETQE